MDDRGELPLLKPMSEVAGRLAAHAAGHYLMHPPAGRACSSAARRASRPPTGQSSAAASSAPRPPRSPWACGADVTILDTSPRRVRELEEQFGRQLRVLHSQGGPAISAVQESDVVIGAVLVPGAAAPSCSPGTTCACSGPGLLLIDVAIDQGGCFETSRPTTYERRPTRWTASPTTAWRTCRARVPRTSTRALTNATLPYVRHLAGLGVDAAFDRDPGLRRGLNTRAGAITHEAVAAAFG